MRTWESDINETAALAPRPVGHGCRSKRLPKALSYMRFGEFLFFLNQHRRYIGYLLRACVCQICTKHKSVEEDIHPTVPRVLNCNSSDL